MLPAALPGEPGHQQPQCLARQLCPGLPTEAAWPLPGHSVLRPEPPVPQDAGAPAAPSPLPVLAPALQAPGPLLCRGAVPSFPGVHCVSPSALEVGSRGHSALTAGRPWLASAVPALEWHPEPREQASPCSLRCTGRTPRSAWTGWSTLAPRSGLRSWRGPGCGPQPPPAPAAPTRASARNLGRLQCPEESRESVLPGSPGTKESPS